MKQYRKDIIRRSAPTCISTTSKLSQNFLKSNKKNIKNQLKFHWEIFLSTYQSSKKNLSFESFYCKQSYSPSVDLKGVKRYSCAPRSFQARSEDFSSDGSPLGLPKGLPLGPPAAATLEGRQPAWNKNFYSDTSQRDSPYGEIYDWENLFYLNQPPPLRGTSGRHRASSNYFILAKIVDLIGAKHTIQNRFRQLIKINTKYLELEKLFQIKFFKNTFFSGGPPFGTSGKGIYWISYLLIEQIYQFIKMNSLFLYQAKSSAPFGPVWRATKNKIEIQKNGAELLFLKCQDFLMLKWYQNKIHIWCEAQIVNKKILPLGVPLGNFNQFDQGSKVIFTPTSHIITSLLGKSCALGFTNTISYSQDETNNLLQKLRAYGKPEAYGKMNHLTKVSNAGGPLKGRLRERYLRLIKKIIQKSKVTTQVELIQKLNEIIGPLGADTFIINNINKRSVAIKLNRILYQFLWRWGLVRHRKQKAKWIKNRYWSLQ